ncbi:hypothetical protein [Haloarcula sp. CGMCC 1.6347]|uniref:hypothetical protein n=1 Tax=Haloarcula sp. CGMCC 1.6347 TaxID=3111455 RepID=UPI00300EF6E2
MDLNPSDVVDEPDAATEAADAVDGGTGDPPSSEPSSSTSTPTESSTSKTEKLKDLLFSTSPEKDLDDVEAPYDPERGGLNRVYRGLQKMVDVDGLPAVADITIGLAEWLDLAEPMDQDGGSSESQDSQNSQNGESKSERPADLEAALSEVKS